MKTSRSKKMLAILIVTVFATSGVVGIVSLNNNNPEWMQDVIDFITGEQEALGTEWIIEGDKVYFEDENVYLSATPHTLQVSGWVEFQLLSKTYSGDIEAIWGFDIGTSRPKRAKIWRNYSHAYTEDGTAHYNITITNITDYENLGMENYGNYPVDYGNEENTKFFSFELNGNETIYVAFLNQTTLSNNSIRVHGLYDGEVSGIKSYFDWKDFNGEIAVYNELHMGYDKWYAINATIQQDKLYRFKVWVEFEFNTDGKYWFGVRRAGDPISKGYWLDPWWEANWIYRRLIQFNASTYMSGGVALNNFPMTVRFDDAFYLNKMHGQDTVFINYYDNSTQLHSERVQFDQTGGKVNATYFVNVTTVRANNPTWAWAYFCNNATSDDFNNATLVWNGNYDMVQHMNETGNAGEPYICSKFTRADTTRMLDYRSDPIETKANRGVDGLMDNCTIFYGHDFNALRSLNERLQVPVNWNVTYEGWVFVNNTGGIRGLMGCDRLEIKTISGYFSVEGSTTIVNSSYKLGTFQWYYLVARFHGGRVDLFVDSVKTNDSELCTNTLLNNAPRRLAYATDGGGTRWWGGCDEVRWTNGTSITEDWINVSYQTGISSAGFFAIVPDAPAPPPAIPPAIGTVYPINNTHCIIPMPASTVWNLTANVTDYEGDQMNITWMTNESGAWLTINTTTLVTNGTYYAYNTSWIDEFDTTYWWNLTVTDSEGNDNHSWFNFTTAPEPTATAPYPINNSLNIFPFLYNTTTTNPHYTDNFSITISNPCNELMTLGFQTNESGGWVLFNASFPVANGTYEGADKSWLNMEDQTIWWRANVSYWGSNLFHYEYYKFTLRDTVAPALSNIQPANQSTNVDVMQATNWTQNDTDGNRMRMEYWSNVTGAWIRWSTGTFDTNQTYSETSLSPQFNEWGKKYYWRICIADEYYEFLAMDYLQYNWNNQTFEFTTARPPTITNEVPTNGSTHQVLNAWCNFTAESYNGVNMNVTWYENSTGVWILRQTNGTATNGSTHWRYAQATSGHTTYWWKAIVNETAGPNATAYFRFTTLNRHPVITLPTIPTNQSVMNYTRWDNQFFYAGLFDADGDTIDYYFGYQTDDNWIWENSTGVFILSSSFDNNFTRFTTYNWTILLWDGFNWTNATFWYRITNGTAPNIHTALAPSPAPDNNSIIPYIYWTENALWQVRVEDPDDDYNLNLTMRADHDAGGVYRNLTGVDPADLLLHSLPSAGFYESDTNWTGGVFYKWYISIHDPYEGWTNYSFNYSLTIDFIDFNFTADNATLVVNFYGNNTMSAVITIDFWTWYFGDGNTSDQQNRTHIYTNATNFTITLIGENHTHGYTDQKTHYVDLSGVVPTPTFIVDIDWSVLVPMLFWIVILVLIFIVGILIKGVSG